MSSDGLNLPTVQPPPPPHPPHLWILGVACCAYWHAQCGETLQGGGAPHSTFRLPPENASETLEGQRVLIICGDHIYRRLVHGAATPT